MKLTSTTNSLNRISSLARIGANASRLVWMLLPLAAIFFCRPAVGQISITNTTPVTENFDGMGLSATATLPANWKFSPPGTAGPDYSSVSNFTATVAQASSGSPSLGTRYNWGNGTTTTDRSPGFISSGSYSSPNSIMVAYRNNNAAAISGLTISYDLERYRINTTASTVSLFYSVDGINWGTALQASTFAAGAASSYTFTTPGLIQVTGVSTGAINIPNSGQFYLRWDFNTGTNSQGIGLDNVSVTAAFAGPPPAITVTGTPLSAVNTTYGTGSPLPTSFSVAGANITQPTGVTITAPANYEVSTASGGPYSSSINVGNTGNFLAIPIFVRLTATAPVVGSPYSGNIVLTSTGATTVNVPTVASTVSPKLLTITANDVSKNYGVALTSGAGFTTFTSSGLVPAQTIGSVTITYGAGGLASAAAGTYANQVTPSLATGGTFTASNYSITYVAGTITVNPVVPVVITPTVGSITNNSAILGANVFSNGNGTGLTARGTSFKTTTPVIATDNQLAEGGTATGIYAHLRSPLAPQTRYYYVGYASNSTGTAISSEGNFFTLSNPPTAQAANLFATASSFSQIDLSWDAAAFPATGATVSGYVLLRGTGAVIPTLSATNGTAPTAGAGVVVTSAIFDPTISFSNTGLLQNTTYNYLLVPYTWDGTNAATYHYLTAGAVTASATTPLGPCTPPTIQASAAAVAGPTASSLTISWTPGNGTTSLVIVRAGSAVNQAPVTGNPYAASNVFGTGDNLGSGNFVCFNGAGSSFTLTNLSATTTYYVAVYTYNTSGYCFNLASPATANGTTTAAPSVIETFEPGTKNSYTNGNDVCNLGNWNFNNALIGTTVGSDRFNGAKSARIQSTGSITMLFNKTNGLGTVSVRHALFGTDPATTWRLDVSDDGGATFNAYQSPVQNTTSTTLTTVSFSPNITGNLIRIRIVKLSGGTSSRLNIDDISLSDYVSTNSVTTGVIAGSPFCVTDVAGISVNVPFTATGVFISGNVYTAQLSDGTGSFASPQNIGTLTSVATSGTISSVIPAGTLTGTAYKIRVISSDPAIFGTPTTSILAINLNTPEVTGVSGGPSNTAIALGWTNPTGCYNDIVVFASTSSITCTPAGDGSAYTANAAFGSGTSCSGAFAVYKGTGASVTVTGLTNGTTYYFKVFVRNGTVWSNGVQITAVPAATLDGDYESRQSGAYNSVNTWAKRVAGSWVYPSPDLPGAGNAGTATVTINSPHIVNMTTSAATSAIKTLIVNTGGRIYGSSSSNTYITIYGDIVCNGTIGTNATTYNSLSFNVEGVNSTISGTGGFYASRIRKNYNVNTISNLIIAKDIYLLWNSGGGTTLYNNSTGTDFNVTVNQNATVNLVLDGATSGNIAINSTTGVGIERGGTFTINGTLNVPGTLYATNSSTSRSCNWVIGSTGVINCNQINADASGTGGHTFTIQNGGRLNINTSVGFNTATATSFSTTNNTWNLLPGSFVEYSANSGVTHVLTNLTYSNLVISGSGTKDLINKDLVTTGLTLNVGRNLIITGTSTLDVVATPSHTININGQWQNYGTAGFNEGTSLVNFGGLGPQTITCPGGENFYNLTISSTNVLGTRLNSDVTVANDLNLGTAGRLFFGPTPTIVRLTKMTNGSNSFLGSGAALVDMSQSACALYIGCETATYAGSFNAGTSSLVNYNRDVAVSGTSGNQDVLTTITYANLSLSGSNLKRTNDNFTVNGNFTVDGSSTSLEANTVGKTLTLGGNLTLSGGATMGGAVGTSCLNNLSIVTSAASAAITQTFDGGLSPVNCFNLSSNKTANGIVLTAGNTNLTINNNLTQTNAAQLTPNDNRVKIGNVWSIWGPAGFNKGTSTVEYTGAVPQTIVGVDYYNLESSSTGTRTMSTVNQVGIENVFTPGTNAYTFTGSTVNYNGSLPQSIAAFTAAATPGSTYDNLTLSNAGVKSLLANTDVEGDLTLNGSVTLAVGNNFMNLKSTATKTARIAQVSAAANITYINGRFVVERYFPGRRSWRLITAPVTADASRSFFNSYQVGGATTLSGSGTYITGASPSIANGLDVSPLNNFSLKTFNPATSQFDNVTNTKTNLIAGTAGVAGAPDNRGFFMFVRGDRTAANINAFNTYGSVNATTLRDTGRVQIKSYTFPCNPSTGPNRYTLVGNPYASPVDFANVSKNNVLNKFQAWDPALNTVGGYVTVDLQLGPAVIVPQGTGTTSQTQVIQSKQAILVETSNATSPSITFTEAAKSSSNNLSLFRPTAPAIPSLALNLHIVNSDGSTTLADGVLAQFRNDFNPGTDHLDAVRFTNVNETISLQEGSEFLMLSRRPMPKQTDSVLLSLRRTRQFKYRFEINSSELNRHNMTGYLADRFMDTFTPLNMNGTTMVDFAVTGNSASSAANRFYIVFKKAFKFHPIKADVVTKDVVVSWSVEDEEGVDKYEVERSADGVHFESIGSVLAKGGTAGLAEYTLTDNQPAAGEYFYRVKGIAISRVETYTEAVKVKVSVSRDQLYVYPNPVKGGVLGLQTSSLAAGTYGIRLINANGQVLLNTRLVHAAGTATEYISYPAGTAAGAYQLEVVGKDQGKKLVPVVIAP